MLHPSSEQKKTLKMERAIGITMNNIMLRMMHERTWDEFFTARGNKEKLQYRLHRKLEDLKLR
jgi:prephenate dehydratase